MSAIDLSIGSWDFLLLLFLAAATISYTFLFVVRGKLVSVLMTTLTAYLLVEFAPFLDSALGARFSFAELWQMRLAVFGTVFLLLFYILSRVILQSPVGAETFGVFPGVLVALTQIGFLLSIIVSYFPVTITSEFSGSIEKLFVSNTALFYWGFAAIILLLFVGNKANRKVG